MEFTVKPARGLAGALVVPGDKSISHRAVMLGSISQGPIEVSNFLRSDDTDATISAFHALGIETKDNSNNGIIIYGRGLYGLSSPATDLSMRNSGTSMRILMGILAGQNFSSTLTAEEGLSKRPMRRVTEPLILMGAKITGKDDANYAPLKIEGAKLKGIDYVSKVASAQVKSAILLAGLYAEGKTSVTEPSKSRDHTERMLKAFGADISVEGLKVTVQGGRELKPQDIDVAGDISSAAFFIVGATIVKGSSVILKSVGVNPTRTGIIDILKMMGAKIKIENIRETAFESVGDIFVESADLRAVTIEGDLIPRAIDELPIIMVAASYAEGTTIIKGAGELKVKETDRIISMATNMNRMGARFSIEGDDVTIKGGRQLKGIAAKSYNDHRTAMSMIIAGLAAKGETTLDNIDCIGKSYPEFIKHLETVSK